MVKFGRHLEYYAAAQQAQQAAASLAEDQQQQQQQQQQTDASATAPIGSIQDAATGGREGGAPPHASLTRPHPHREVSFLVNDGTAHEVYVVPYNDIKARCIPPYSHGELMSGKEEEKDGENDAAAAEDDKKEAAAPSGAVAIESCSKEEVGQPAASLTRSKSKGRHRDKPLPSPLSADDAYFLAQRFKTEWRQCLASASRDFERSTKRFWRTVFEGLERRAADRDEEEEDGSDSDDEDGDAAVNNEESKVRAQNAIDPDLIRGALPDTALRLYLTHTALDPPSSSTHAEVQHLYTLLKTIHSTALINSEALRKLVKKFDKEMAKLRARPGTDGARRLSPRLLPEIYSANFNVGLPTVEAGLALVRFHLGLDMEEYDDEEEGDNDEVHAARIKFMSMDGGAGGLAGLTGGGGGGGGPNDLVDVDGGPPEDVAGFFGLTLKRRDADQILVEKRKSELRWLRKLVESVKEADAQARADGDGFAVDMISCLVGHRGFHSIKDKSDKRPLENSLMAYEAAWTNGIHLCECDIALTADDKLILAHDENFSRLALDLDDPLVHRNVRELTYKEIMSLPLKSGNRPPLLFDVLRSAQVIGGDARMIVEIKPGNVEAGTALAKMFARHPHLMERVAVVMSFDAYAMQNLKRELELVFPSCDPSDGGAAAAGGGPPRIPSPRSAMKVGSPAHELATAGFAAIAGSASSANLVGSAHSTRSGHRRGISVGGKAGFGSGVIPNIPTAMSITDINAMGPAPSVPAEGLGGREHSKSIEGLGLALEGLDGIGVRKDSFNFTPFGQLGRVPSINRQISGDAKLIPPLIPPAAAAQHTAKLETIPGGVRVENAKPHPARASPPLMQESPAPSPPTQLAPHATTVVVPLLLLITRNGPAKNKEQEDALEVDVSKPSDVERVKAWLHGNSASDRLDGLYMQYQPLMLEPEGVEAMQAISDHYKVGIWGANPKPDDYDCFSRLIRDCGVSYVNSGLPKRFMRKMARSESFAHMPDIGKDVTAEEMERINSLTWPKQQQQPVYFGLPW